VRRRAGGRKTSPEAEFLRGYCDFVRRRNEAGPVALASSSIDLRQGRCIIRAGWQ
ncbi:hypothetical protein PanWU01x14_320420, partial [Parasponia andersonii]